MVGYASISRYSYALGFSKTTHIRFMWNLARKESVCGARLGPVNKVNLGSGADPEAQGGKLRFHDLGVTTYILPSHSDLSRVLHSI